MSKLSDLKAQEDEEVTLDMSPMIDMVFLLLIFFIVSAKVIKLKQVQEVEPPVISEGAKPQGKIDGRIVFNVYKDGTVTDIDGKSGKVFPDETEIKNFINERKQNLISNGIQEADLEIHIRGDRETEFQHIRKVNKAAGEAGISKIVYASMDRES